MADFDNGREGFSIGIDDSQLQSDAEKVVQQFDNIGRRATQAGQKIDSAFGGVSTEALQQETKAAEDKIHDLGNATKSETEKMDASLKKIAAGIGAYFSIQQLTQFESKVISIRSEMESLQTSFKTLAGEQVGGELFEQIKEYELRTPMIMQDLASGAQTMLAFNIPAQDVMQHLKAIGDISMGDSEKFKSLTLAFSQMSATGKLMGQDLLQMINAGFNPLQVISEQTGKSIGQLKEEMEKGAITTKMVQDAFHAAASEGGQFNGMLEAQSKTLKGAISNLEGAWQYMLNDIGEAQEGLIVGSIDMAQKIIANYQQVGQIIMGLITTYGIYKAAVVTAIAAEKLHIETLTIAKVRIAVVEKVQAALNATMLANPYVAAATALGVLVGVLVACHDSTTAEEKAQAALNETMETAKQKQQEYNDETDRAIERAQQDEDATHGRKKAMDLLIQRYPAIIKKYIDEEGHLRNILKLKQEIAAQDGLNRVRSLQTDKNDADRATRAFKLEQQARNKAVSAGMGASQYRQFLTGSQQAEVDWANKWYKQKTNQPWYRGATIEEQIKFSKDYSVGANKNVARELTTQNADKFAETFKDMTKQQLQQVINTLTKGKRTGKNVRFNLKGLGNYAYSQSDILSMLTKAQGIAAARTRSKTTYNKSDWEKQQKEAQAKLDQMADSQKGSKEWNQQVSLVKEAQDHIASRTVSTHQSRTTAAHKQQTEAEKAAKEQAKANEKTAEETYRYSQQQEQQQKANQLLQAQAIVDAMQEGEAKKLAQLDLNYKKEKDAIDKEEQSLLQAKIDHAKNLWDADPKHENQGFYATGQQKGIKLTDEEKAGITAKKQSLDATTTQQRSELIKALLDKYDDENEKAEKTRKAITDDIVQLTKLRDEAEKLGQNDIAKNYEHKRQQAAQALEENIQSVYLEELKKSIDWDAVFNNLDRQTTEQLKATRDKLTSYKNSKEYQQATPENKKVVSTAIDQLNDAIIKGSGIFGNLAENCKAYEKASERYTTALQELNIALSEFDDIEDSDAPEEAKEAAKKKVEAAQKKADDAKKDKDTSKVNRDKSFDTTTDNLIQLSQAITQLGSTSEMSLSELGNVASNVANVFGKAGSKIGGIIGAILSLLDAIQKQGLFKFVGNVFQSAFGAVGGVFRSLTGSKLFGTDTSIEDTINDLTQSNQDLESAVTRLTEVMKDKAGQEATDTYQRAKKNLEDATANKQQILRDTGGAYKNGFIGIGGKHSSNAHINDSMSSADWQRISQITGENVRSASDFWNLTSEQMAKVADEATDLWSKIKNASNDGYKSNASNMDEYIEYYKKLIDLQNDYNEAVTNLSFDNTRDGLKELLSDTTKGVKDATKKVKEYMEEAVLTYITKTTLAKDMQDWYTQFASAMADGKLDQSEKTDLQKKYEEAYRKGEQARDNAYAAAGIDPKEDYTQSSTSATLSGATQDQQDETNGRLTSIQNSLSIVADAVQQQVENNAIIANSAAIIRSNMDDMMEMQIQAVGYLEKIERHTSELPSMNQKLEKIRKNTEKL
ncbi:tape measure protein [Segatella copri]|uniref:tape measure protein n=1 Tax=Segatella copri TaxID=165179 RepID=UPI0012926DAA|nr:tape measure protein [Segatella copri]MQN15329.1 tape measure protein [Segatella copri]MQN19605.1 tape measure protein [Segatella copri]